MEGTSVGEGTGPICHCWSKIPCMAVGSCVDGNFRQPWLCGETIMLGRLCCCKLIKMQREDETKLPRSG